MMIVMYVYNQAKLEWKVENRGKIHIILTLYSIVIADPHSRSLGQASQCPSCHFNHKHLSSGSWTSV